VLWKAWPDGDSTGSAGSPWTYDTAGRLLAVPGGIASTAYNAAGQVTAIAYANGVTTTNTYNDARAFLIGHRHQGRGARHHQQRRLHKRRRRPHPHIRLQPDRRELDLRRSLPPT
jgi:YD repeat-containing protein